MQKKHALMLIFLLPVGLFAQPFPPSCDKVFVKVEQLPSLSISPEAFGDTLVTALQKRDFRLKDDSITYSFVVTDSALIYGIEVYSGSVSKENILRETILHYVYLWKPAIQNGHKVCAFIQLDLKFLDKKIYMRITQERPPDW